MKYSTLVRRLGAGMPSEETITAPNQREGVGIDSKAITAFGITKSAAAWESHRRARVGASTIRKRIERGMEAEVAITGQAFKRTRA